ncbi:hypothetical protein [Methanopyrus kandleri]
MVSPVFLLSAVLLAPSIVPSLPTVVVMVLALFTAWIAIALLISRSHKVCADVIRGVLEVVRAAEGLVGVTFEGRSTRDELDSRFSGLLEVPNDAVSLRTGVQFVVRGSTEGRRGSLRRALEVVGSDENMRELAREGRLVTFRVRLEGETEGYRLRGVVVPLGRRPEDDAPMVALLGTGRRDDLIHDIVHLIFDRDDDEFELAFGGVVPVGRVFSEFDRLHEDTGDGVGDGGDGDDGDGGNGGN